MADKTAEQFSVQAVFPTYLKFGVAANETIYAGCMVILIDGYAYQADDAAKGCFVGVARETVVGTAADGGVDIEVQIPGPAMPMLEVNATSPAVATWLGQVVYIVDSVSVALKATTSKDVPLGVCVSVTKTGTSGRVIVDLTRTFAAADAGTVPEQS